MRIYSQKTTLRSGAAFKRNNLIASLSRHRLKLKHLILKIAQHRRVSMSNQAIAEYLLVIASKYKNSSKQKKTMILNDAQEITGLSRKRLIRRLNGSEHSRRKSGSGCLQTYLKEELLPHIKFLWIQMEKISAPRMKEALKDWLNNYSECPGYLKLQLLIDI